MKGDKRAVDVGACECLSDSEILNSSGRRLASIPPNEQ